MKTLRYLLQGLVILGSLWQISYLKEIELLNNTIPLKFHVMAHDFEKEKERINIQAEHFKKHFKGCLNCGTNVEPNTFNFKPYEIIELIQLF